MSKIELSHKTEIKVRFHEVDSMGVVWHGSYVNYLEDARESFGEKYGIHYLDFLREGLVVPLVNMELEYKKPLKYGDNAIVEIKLVESDAAKLIFEYIIFRSHDNEIAATAKTVQVFLNTKMELLLTFPEFFAKWKENHSIN